MSDSLSSNQVVQALNVYLRHHPEGAWYRSEEIPPTKLKNAILKYAKGVSPSSVLALADGTVFGSGKEGLLLTAERLYVKTVEETFSLRLSKIREARAVSGWPNYTIEINSSDDLTYRIATICFDQQQAHLVQFFNAIGEANGAVPSYEPEFSTAVDPGNPTEAVEPIAPTEPVSEAPVTVPFASPTAVEQRSVQSVNSGLRLISICPHAEIQDADELFQTAFQASEEWPLVKGYCRYVGFNQREVEGLFLLTNRRLILFSSESGLKIFLVEMTMRFLDKVPFPFFDSVVGFFLFKIPRALYVALRGGRGKMIERVLGLDNQQLMSAKPPARKVQEFSYQQLAETVDRIEIGSGIWTGILSRAFGVSFAPNGLTKTFSIPKDLILPEYETLEPFAELFFAINSSLEQRGLTVVIDEDGQKLSLLRRTPAQQEAA